MASTLPPRPNLNVNGQNADGTTVGSSPSTAPPAINFWQKYHKEIFSVIFGAILISLSTFLINVHSFMYHVDLTLKDFKPESYNTSLKIIEKDIEYLKSLHTSPVQPYTTIKDPRPTNESTPNSITIGLMLDQVPKSKRTSAGLEYKKNFHQLNLCEINGSYDWEGAGQNEPTAREFYQLQNTTAKLNSWCFVIGKFNDNNNRNRAFVITRKVMESLTAQGTIPKEISPILFNKMQKSEWNGSKECRFVYEAYSQ